MAGLTALIALRIFRSPPAAWLAGIAAAIHPILVNSASQPYNEDLFFFLFVVAIWVLLIWLESLRPIAAIGCGILIGIGMLTRENASLLLIGIGAVLIVQKATLKMWRGFALMVLMTAVCVLPWTARNWVQFHAFVPVASIMGVDFVDGNNECVAAEGFFVPYWAEGRCPQVGEQLNQAVASMIFDERTPAAIRLDQAGKRVALQFVREHPAAYIKLALRRLWTSLLPYDPRGNQHREERLVLAIYWLLVYPAGVVGIVLALKARPSPGNTLLVLLIVLNLGAMMAVLYWSDLRFRVGVDLLFGCFAGYAYSRLAGRVQPEDAANWKRSTVASA
jgi:4-amino-4-deoxy-L-arabinose transferase-like glycosyltransferase